MVVTVELLAVDVMNVDEVMVVVTTEVMLVVVLASVLVSLTIAVLAPLPASVLVSLTVAVLTVLLWIASISVEKIELVVVVSSDNPVPNHEFFNLFVSNNSRM
jgi:hypothetical protein